MFVMLRKDWPGSFRRTFGDAKDRQMLEWSPGDVMELKTEAEIAAVKDDIGKALVVKNPPVVASAPIPQETKPEPQQKRK